MKQRMLLTMALVLLCLGLCCGGAGAEEIIASGDFGGDEVSFYTASWGYETVQSAVMHWELDTDGVLTVSGYGFMGKTYPTPWNDWKAELREVRIEEGVRSISGNAFYTDLYGGAVAYPALTRVSLPASLEVLPYGESNGMCAFQGCPNLTTIEIAAGNPSFQTISGLLYTRFDSVSEYSAYGPGCLLLCPGGIRGAVQIADGAKTVALHAFDRCSLIESIVVPDSVTYLGHSAIMNMERLRAVSVGKGIQDFMLGMFSNCPALAVVDLAEGNPSYFSRDGAVYRVLQDDELTGDFGIYHTGDVLLWSLPEGKNELTLEADVRDIIVPDLTHVETLTASPDSLWFYAADGVLYNRDQTAALMGYGSASVLHLADTVTEVSSGAFEWNEQIRSVRLPDGLKTIGDFAFEGCTALTQVRIPAGVREIGSDAFDRCSALEWVALPDMRPDGPTDLRYAISYDAFGGCDSLRDVYFAGDETAWEGMRSWIADGNDALFDAEIHFNATGPDVLSETYVRRAYEGILGREADEAGLADWVEKLENGVGAGEIINEFFRSEEYRSRGLSAEETVSLCYQAMLGREPGADEIANWAALLNDGYSTTRIVGEFVASDEFKTICGKYGLIAGSIALDACDQNSNITRFVDRCYKLTLGRAPDESGLNEWCAHLIRQDLTPERVAFGFVFSDEAKKQGLDDTAFIEMLYRMMLDREPDADGLANWVSALQQNTAAEIAYDQAFETGRSEGDAIDQTRQNIYALFAASDEFALMCANFGF